MNPQKLWDAIPLPVRTILNVGITGALLVFFGAIVSAKGVTGVDWAAVGRATLDAFGLGVATAVVRSLNPLDTLYGVKAVQPAPTGDVQDQ